MYLKVQLYSTKFRVPVCCLSVLNLAKFGYGCVTVLPEGTTKFSYSCLHLRSSAKFRRYRYIRVPGRIRTAVRGRELHVLVVPVLGE